MLTIAKYEAIQMLRDPLVIIMSTVMPLGMAGFLYWQIGDVDISPVAAMIPFIMGAFVVYGAAVTALASRRQNLFLKRLRCTAESDAGIVLGLVSTLVLLAVIEAVGVLAVFAVLQTPPANILLTVVVGILVLALYVGFALATAGFTKSADSAQVTTIPVAMGLIGIATWVMVTGTETLTGLKLALPGGAAVELALGAWRGIEWADAAIPMLITLVWTAIAFLAAKVFFKWEPRR
ncbi:ABC transporter permease [Brevibacterium album]|uniref:ABC transporter permease n=1 Tax=Brevibacterium album TaxID=417948 RepID=UPI00048C81D9|nr:hypothetical protein [Brevibacterium album]